MRVSGLRFSGSGVESSWVWGLGFNVLGFGFGVLFLDLTSRMVCRSFFFWDSGLVGLVVLDGFGVLNSRL